MESNNVRNKKLYAHRTPWNNGIEFLLTGSDWNGETFYGATPPDFSERRSGTTPTEPTFFLEIESAQLLMDELWNCGLRPTEGSGSAGAMAATQAHLKDLQEENKRLWNALHNSVVK